VAILCWSTRLQKTNCWVLRGVASQRSRPAATMLAFCRIKAPFCHQQCRPRIQSGSTRYMQRKTAYSIISLPFLSLINVNQPALDVLSTPYYTLLPADPIWIIDRFSRSRATTAPMASRRFAWQHLLPAPAQAYSELLRCGHRARATGCSKRANCPSQPWKPG